MKSIKNEVPHLSLLGQQSRTKVLLAKSFQIMTWAIFCLGKAAVQSLPMVPKQDKTGHGDDGKCIVSTTVERSNLNRPQRMLIETELSECLRKRFWVRTKAAKCGQLKRTVESY